MRIISGKHKHRMFQIPKSFNARPTTDFAKENLFNILNNIMDFKDIVALDLFSGTGSISFELISRGAKNVLAVEQRREHVLFIKEVAKKLKEENKIKVIPADVFSFISKYKYKTTFDFVFADPPYKLTNIDELPQLIFSSGILNNDAILIIEHSEKYSFSDKKFFIDHRVYGSVNFSFFKYDNKQI